MKINRRNCRNDILALSIFTGTIFTNCDHRVDISERHVTVMSGQPQLADPMGLAGGDGRGQGRGQLSPEEKRVMDSCNSEAFYYRSLPFSAFLGTLAHLGVQRGYLRPSLNYGSGPKVILSGMIGYFLGKASYVNVCADKFLVEAPDSHVADAIRFNRGIPTRNPNFEEEMKSRTGMAGGNNPMTDGGHQTTPQSPIYNNPASPTYSQPSEPLSGYDELRRKNREAAAPGFSAGSNPHQPVSLSPPPPPPPSSEAAPPSKLRPIQPQGSKNKYGDEGFE